MRVFESQQELVDFCLNLPMESLEKAIKDGTRLPCLQLYSLCKELKDKYSKKEYNLSKEEGEEMFALRQKILELRFMELQMQTRKAMVGFKNSNYQNDSDRPFYFIEEEFYHLLENDPLQNYEKIETLSERSKRYPY